MERQCYRILLVLLGGPLPFHHSSLLSFIGTVKRYSLRNNIWWIFLKKHSSPNLISYMQAVMKIHPTQTFVAAIFLTERQEEWWWWWWRRGRRWRRSSSICWSFGNSLGKSLNNNTNFICIDIWGYYNWQLPMLNRYFLPGNKSCRNISSKKTLQKCDNDPPIVIMALSWSEVFSSSENGCEGVFCLFYFLWVDRPTICCFSDVCNIWSLFCMCSFRRGLCDHYGKGVITSDY